MGALAQLSSTTVDVEPGRSVTIGLTVRNNGAVVDRYRFEAVGAAAPWVTFSPDTLSLFPEASGIVNVVLSPPRLSSVTAGPIPFGIRVASTEEPQGSVVEEGTINVGAFSDLTIDLVPRVAVGRLMGRVQLAVDNRSNCVYRADLSGTDPKSQLAFRFNPPTIDVAPGQAAFSKIAIRPAKRFWRGPQQHHMFTLAVRAAATTPDSLSTPPLGTPAVGAGGPSGSRPSGSPASPDATGAPAAAAPASAAAPAPAPAPAGSPPGARPGASVRPHPAELTTDGTMLQEALLPRWLLLAIGALVALAALLVLLWFVLFKPQLRDTAQKEVNKQLASQGLISSGTGSGSGGSSGSGGGGSGGGSGSSTVSTPANGSGSSSTGVPGVGGVTINGEAQASGNGTKVAYTVPNGKSLEITDIVVENSAGNSGNVTLARSGTTVIAWSMANFRDLDYHWITPTVFGSGTQVQMVVSGCSGACTPGIYFAGHLVNG